VALRRQRQRFLTHSDAIFWAIIDEGALRRPMGGRDVMREQLNHLLHLMRHRSMLRIQVLPFETSGPPGQVAFSYLRFADRELLELSRLPGLYRKIVYLEVVCHEHLTSALYLDKPEDVEPYRAVFQRLTTTARHTWTTAPRSSRRSWRICSRSPPSDDGNRVKGYLLCAGVPAAAQLLPDAAIAVQGKGSLLIAGLAVVAMFTLQLVRERHVHAEVLILLHGLDPGSPPADAAAPLEVLTARAATTGARRPGRGSGAEPAAEPQVLRVPR
jgi:hypothetical protein